MADTSWRTPINVKFTASSGAPAGSITVYPVFDLGSHDKTCKGGPASMPADSKLFSAKRGQTMIVQDLGRSVMLLGMGTPDSLDATACEEVGAALQKALTAQSARSVFIQPVRAEQLKKGKPGTPAAIAAHIASGTLLKGYSFQKYKSAANDGARPFDLAFCCADPKAAEAAFAPLKAVAEGVYIARDLANEPPNVAYPQAVANAIHDAFRGSNVRIRTFYADNLREMKAGGILAVGQGSKRPPCMVVMDYNGTGGEGDRPALALVGKGVTFDTGGISLKPGANMQDMKYDMSGAADVIGTMLALSARKANVHVVGVVGLAENMPDGGAYRPGDVIRLMSGKTVEVTNTDAEGRLVLSDCLTWVEKTHKPKAIIDLATLTGACVAALGHTFAAVLTRDEKLERWIVKAGRAVDELCHPMPLHEAFTQAVRGSKIADLNNSVPGPGTSTAGAFLEQAILNKTPWAHLDIAGMAWGAPGKLRPDDGTATGFGVRLLNRLIADYFEEKTAKPRLDAAPKHAV